MKIAIPVDSNNIDTKISQSFGRAAYFLIYDTETEDAQFISNTAASSPGGAGIKAAQTVVDSNASALLVPRCGHNAAEILKSANVSIYKTKSVLLMENIAAFKEGRLEPLQESYAGFNKKYGG